jgi:hypothetical protein
MKEPNIASQKRNPPLKTYPNVQVLVTTCGYQHLHIGVKLWGKIYCLRFMVCIVEKKYAQLFSMKTFFASSPERKLFFFCLRFYC